MSIDAVFDVFGKASKIIQIKDQRQKRLLQIKSVQSKECGNCHHWMKNSCKAEKKFGQFKSVEDIACEDFVLSYRSERMVKEFIEELQKIEE